MKRYLLLLALTGCARMCGYSGRDSELIGQVKKVSHRTPLICPDWDAVDISLGVFRNGVGSASKEDVWMTVRDPATFEFLKKASESGSLVRIKYDEYRVTFCIEDMVVRSAEVAP